MCPDRNWNGSMCADLPTSSSTETAFILLTIHLSTHDSLLLTCENCYVSTKS